MTQNTKFEETKDNTMMLCCWEISAHRVLDSPLLLNSLWLDEDFLTVIYGCLVFLQPFAHNFKLSCPMPRSSRLRKSQDSTLLGTFRTQDKMIRKAMYIAVSTMQTTELPKSILAPRAFFSRAYWWLGTLLRISAGRRRREQPSPSHYVTGSKQETIMEFHESHKHMIS